MVTALLLNAGAAGAGTATSGNLTFSWDDAFWGSSVASVIGNSLTFSGLGYRASSSGLPVTYNHGSGTAISVVANSGYSIKSMDFSGTGTYTVTGTNPNTLAEAGISMWDSSVSTSPFIPDAYFSMNASGTGQYSASSLGNVIGTPRLDYGVGFWGSANPAGSGTVSVTADAATFSFNVAQVSPVPEPETCTMLFTGLGLLGFMVRRRKPDQV